MSNLCIIPARGGSKRIPRKNIKDFLGKPIIAYAVELAIKSNLFDKIIVSTDSAEIAEIAIKYGAEVPFIRSDINADDTATLADVVDEVLDYYKGTYDFLCCLLPTAILTTEEHLTEALNILESNEFDSVRPIVQFSYPIQRAFKLFEGGQVSWFNPKYEKSRTQDLEVAYHDAGQFYWMKKEKGLRSNNRGAIIIKESATQDIDTDEDWLIAELKYKLLHKI